MSNQKEKIFADGFRFERRANAPEYVVGRLSIKADEAITFIKSYEKGGWVNLNILYGRSGNPYVELDTYEPKKNGNSGEQHDNTDNRPKQPAHTPSVDDSEMEDDLPF